MDSLYIPKRPKTSTKVSDTAALVPSSSGRRVGILRRWSTQGQTSNIRSELQFSDMDAVITGQGWEPVHYDDQQTSGRKSVLSRREASRMLEDLREGRIQGIGAIELSRIAREPSGLDMAQFTQALLKQNAPIILADEILWPSNPQDRLKIDFLRIIAAYEWDQIRGRTWKSNIIRRLDQDSPTNGAKAPRGYHHIPTGETAKGRPQRKLAKNPAEARMIHDFFRIAPDCISMSEAARRMTELGHMLPKRGSSGTRSWTYMDVYHLINQPLYSGRKAVGRWRGETDVWGLVPETSASIPFLDQPELKYVEPHVQDAIHRHWLEQRPTTPGPRGKRPENILASVLRCVHCGSPMWYRGQNRVAADGVNEYSRSMYCSLAARERGKCPGQVVKEMLAIRAVYEFTQQALGESLREQSGQRAAALGQGNVGEDIKHAQYRIRMLGEEKDRIAEYLIKYADTPSLRDTFEKKLLENEQTLDAVQEEMRSLVELARVPAMLEEVRSLQEDLPEKILSTPLSFQRRLITTLFRELRVDGTGGGQSRKLYVVYALQVFKQTPDILPLPVTPWMEKEQRWAQEKQRRIDDGEPITLTPRDRRALLRVQVANQVLELGEPTVVAWWLVQGLAVAI